LIISEQSKKPTKNPQIEKKIACMKEEKKENSVHTSDESEYDDEESQEVSGFSQITLNDFIEEKKEYISVNMMI